ncbi:MAG: Ribokinase [Modestobacter sp.]|nr:Ribokinase [Modestobacter sp.]
MTEPRHPVSSGPTPFVVLGEALVDLVGAQGSRELVARPGGSPANVALGLARLGEPVTLVTRLGRDAFGEMVAAYLEAGGVRVDRGPDDGVRTSLAVATLAGANVSYDFRIDWHLGPLPPLAPETRCLHTGSLATALAPGSASVLELLVREHRRGRVTVSYDPDVRPALLGAPDAARPGVEHLVGLSDVVKVSHEDLDWLYPGRGYEEVAREWLGRGPALVVVTRGADGVFAVTQRVAVHRPAAPTVLVDTVGAGDSFTAGLLFGLGRADLLGGPRRAALAEIAEPTLIGVLEMAGRVSALTCARPGADLPTLAELESR